VWWRLRRDGVDVGRCRVERLMRRMGCHPLKIQELQLQELRTRAEVVSIFVEVEVAVPHLRPAVR
jgi:hypothetical protein